MATVKIGFNKNAAQTITYVLGHGQATDPKLGYMVPTTKEAAIQSFKGVRESFPEVKGANECAHIIQSFSHEESSKFHASFFSELGYQLATEQFPGHQVLVVTHTDTKHVHNHIVVNTVNFETGKRIQNKFHHLHDLRERSDKLCADRGLSVVDRGRSQRQEKMPDAVRKMAKAGRFSYILDIKQKADFARTFSRSYDEYSSTLSELGVTARVEKKNITYFYPGYTRGKRGKSLGAKYDKDGLEKVFRENDERFARDPHLAKVFYGSKTEALKNPTEFFSQKDYSKFTKVSRRGPAAAGISDENLKQLSIPLSEIRKARGASIVSYCEQNKIGLHKLSDGSHRLIGREYVEIRGSEWVNTKNNTKGSVIDFVAYHKKVSFLKAVSEINRNPRLLILESKMGEAKRPFTSFNIPKPQTAAKEKAAKVLLDFFGALGIQPKHAPHLLEKGQAQVSKEGVIRLFAKDDDGGAFEFVKDEKGHYTKRKLGEFKRPFHVSTSTPGKSVTVHLDPLSFLKERGDRHLNAKDKKTHIILMEPKREVLDLFIAENPQVKSLEFAHTHEKKIHEDFLRLFESVKKEYTKFGIEVNPFSERGKSHGAELEI